MTTLTPTAPRGVRAVVGGRGFATLLRTESRVWLRDASGHLCYGSERLVAANRDATATVPLTRVAPR